MKSIKCDRCGWKYGNVFHICVDTSKPAPVSLRKKKKRIYTGNPATDEQLEHLTEGRDIRWANYREKQEPLKRKIIDRYREGGISCRQLATEFNVSYGYVQRTVQARKNNSYGDRDREIFKLGGDGAVSFDTLAEKFNLSKSRISQIIRSERNKL